MKIKDELVINKGISYIDFEITKRRTFWDERFS